LCEKDGHRGKNSNVGRKLLYEIYESMENQKPPHQHSNFYHHQTAESEKSYWEISSDSSKSLPSTFLASEKKLLLFRVIWQELAGR
jgi:hypothetical protein